MKERFVHLSYQITGDPKEADHPYHYSDELIGMIIKYSQMAARANTKLLPRIIKAIKKYPRVPALRNCLSTYYNNIGNTEKAYATNQRIIEKFPDYVIARINKAAEYIHKEEFHAIPEILGEALDLKALYPNRNVFHFSEFLQFNVMVTHYLVETEQLDALASRLPMLVEVLGLDHELVQYIEEMLMPDDSFEEDGLTPFSPFQDRGYNYKLSTRKQPVFHHPEVKSLTKTELKSVAKIYPKLLHLPKQTLIADLETLLWDSIKRYEYWMDKLEEDDRYFPGFPIHALLLLRELKHDEALKPILTLLRQGFFFMDNWYGDMITEEWWRFIYPYVADNIPMLQAFIQESNTYQYSKLIAITALVQYGLHEPDQKEKVTNCLSEIMQFFLDHQDDAENICDPEFCASLLVEVSILSSADLLALSRKFYKAPSIEPYLHEGIEDMIETFHNALENPDSARSALPISAIEDAEQLSIFWFED